MNEPSKYTQWSSSAEWKKFKENTAMSAMKAKFR